MKGEEKLTIRSDMEEAIKILEKMKNYDSEGFANQLLYWVKEMSFFYSTLVEIQLNKDPSKTFYKITPSARPKEGQVAYFNLRRGYPKETYDGHYCYILKDLGVKFIIIPTTSVKENSTSLNPDFEFDITLDNFTNELTSRMQISDIRAVDAQRINEKKRIYDVKTDKSLILESINKILLG